jgi:hypothetical protein
MIQTNISRFDGGISDDPRQNTTNGFQVSEHFDIFTFPNKLVPYRSSESDTNDGSSATGMKQYKIRDFVYGNDGKLYGLGQQASLSRSKVFSKADPTTGNWTLEATAEAAGLLIYGSFTEWGTTPALWMFSGTTNVSKWTIGSTFTDTVATVGTITTVAQSVIAADDNMYMFYNNKVVRVTPAGAVTDAVLSLPATGRITSACNYGKYLAITWVNGASALGNGRAYVYLWDLVSADVSERIDWGDGVNNLIIGNVDDVIIGVSDNQASSSLGVGGGRFYVKVYSGGAPQVIKEIKATSTVTAGKFSKTVYVKDSKMYWVMSAAFNGLSEIAGIWAVGKNLNGNYVVTIDHIEEAVNSNGIQGFALYGNYVWIAHSADGSITKTDDQPTYTETSIYESQKFVNSKQNKKIAGVWVTFEALPAAGQVVLRYRKDAETSWTTIFTETTDNAVSHESINIESTGLAFPDFREIQFRIQSTGGAVITGFGFNSQDLIGLTK